MMNIKRLGSVSLGHLAIDTLNSSIAMILTALAVPFGLSNSQIGFGVMVYALVGSLSQPYFGWLADRFSGRWLGAAGLLWTALFYSAATFAHNYATLLGLMALAALGSGAFHPQGAMNASDAGKLRASSATAIFFLFGQIGLAAGPMIAGIMLEQAGLAGVRTVALILTPAVLLMALGLRQPIGHHHEAHPTGHVPATADDTKAVTPQPAQRRTDRRWLVVGAFALLVALRATVQQGYYGLLPKFFADQGYTPAEYGFMVGIFSLALAIGTLGGGILGDRVTHRKLLLWSMLLAAPVTYAMLNVQGWPFYLLASAAGFLVGVPHSILVVMAQRLLPKRQGFASGAVLGFMFATGAAGTGLAGWVADWVGLSAVLHGVALLPIGAGLSALLLRKQPKPARQMVASAPAVEVGR